MPLPNYRRVFLISSKDSGLKTGWVTFFALFRSILINGSPTPEFHLEKDLRQGDPLSPSHSS
ncbi:hypothetical protein ACS0TY_026398 [Phlomoides rotata]